MRLWLPGMAPTGGSWTVARCLVPGSVCLPSVGRCCKRGAGQEGSPGCAAVRCAHNLPGSETTLLRSRRSSRLVAGRWDPKPSARRRLGRGPSS